MSGITQLAVGANGYLYSAWSQGVYDVFPRVDIFFARSTDGGETFSERLNLTNNPSATNAGARMVAAGDRIYIISEAISGILFSRSTDRGQTFSKPKNISNNPFGAANAEMAIIESGKLVDEGITEDVIYVVWQGGPGNRIFFSVSLDSGQTFSEPEDISNTPNYSGGPRIAAVGTNVYVTWMGNVAGRFQAFFIRGQLETSKEPAIIRRPELNGIDE